MSELILVPTEFELKKLEKADPRLIDSCRVELCGFGAIAAAARTAGILGSRKPDRCLLIGIAGSYDLNRCTIGSAYNFQNVSCFGIGANADGSLLKPSQMGFSQWSHEELRIDDTIELTSEAVGHNAVKLVSACASSGSDTDVAERLEHFPDAVAEDMEGFGVAMACKMSGVRLSIIRGISNKAGDRDQATWEIDRAIAAVIPHFRTWLD